VDPRTATEIQAEQEIKDVENIAQHDRILNSARLLSETEYYNSGTEQLAADQRHCVQMYFQEHKKRHFSASQAQRLQRSRNRLTRGMASALAKEVSYRITF
jgi:hypothetical protein